MRSNRPISTTGGGIRLQLRVQPRASRQEVAGVAGDAIRVRLTAPPADGAANEALVRFLAARLAVSRDAVALISGHSGRTKVVEVAGLCRRGEQAARSLSPCRKRGSR